MWVAFANAKATHIFFSKNISLYAIFNDQSFNNMLTNNIVSFEQLGPDILFLHENVLLVQTNQPNWERRKWSYDTVLCLGPVVCGIPLTLLTFL